jgi:hypothetical protein
LGLPVTFGEASIDHLYSLQQHGSPFARGLLLPGHFGSDHCRLSEELLDGRPDTRPFPLRSSEHTGQI